MRVKKQSNDFSAEAETVLKQAQVLVNKKQKDKAVSLLLNLEKKARLGGDYKTVTKSCQVILRIFTQKKDFDELNHYISLLCKRRSQSEAVQNAIIVFGAERILEDIQNMSLSEKIKMEVIEKVIMTLRIVAAGKLQVEVVRAKLTRKLAGIKEKSGDIKGAYRLMQEETPETYSSMERKVKMEYILEQIRLCLLVDDFIRAKILIKKVDKNNLEQDHFKDLKIVYYTHIITFTNFDRNPLEASKAHLAIYNVTGEESQFQAAIINLACAKASVEQISIIKGIVSEHSRKKNSLKVQTYLTFVSHFVAQEVIQWPFPDSRIIFENKLLKEGFAESKDLLSHKKKLSSDNNAWRYYMLFDRIMQHDIRIIAKYYSRISLNRLVLLLNLSSSELERQIGFMVYDSDFQVKVNRVEGIVSFEGKVPLATNLVSWTAALGELVSIVDETCHLVHKENMLYEALQTRSQTTK